jgi:hypothetical protein
MRSLRATFIGSWATTNQSWRMDHMIVLLQERNDWIPQPATAALPMHRNERRHVSTLPTKCPVGRRSAAVLVHCYARVTR